MPTRKIADLPKEKTCRDPDHNIPSMRCYEPGTYEHICPSCGNKIVFSIPKIECVKKWIKENFIL